MESGFIVEAIDVSRSKRANSDVLGVAVAVASELPVALFAGVSCISIFSEEMDDCCNCEGSFDKDCSPSRTDR